MLPNVTENHLFQAENNRSLTSLVIAHDTTPVDKVPNLLSAAVLVRSSVRAAWEENQSREEWCVSDTLVDDIDYYDYYKDLSHSKVATKQD